MWVEAFHVYSSLPVRRSYSWTAESANTPLLTPPSPERSARTFLLAVTQASWPRMTIACSVSTQPSAPLSVAIRR